MFRLPTISVLMAAHACEVIVWSLAYVIVAAAPASADPVYFAFVNYTTLGYGDVTPVERWRLLGPMTDEERGHEDSLAGAGMPIPVD
jgi:ion channel